MFGLFYYMYMDGELEHINFLDDGLTWSFDDSFV
jgi:hypothetical protein